MNHEPITKSILSDDHWKIKDYKQRITKAQWRGLLLNYQDEIVYKGTITKLKAVDLGCGVLEISKDFPK